MTPTAALTLRDRSPALAADAFVARNAHALGMARGFRRPRRAPDVTVLCMMETGNLGAADAGTVDGTTMMAPVGSFGHGTHQGSTSPQIDGSFRSPATQSREPPVVPNHPRTRGSPTMRPPGPGWASMAECPRRARSGATSSEHCASPTSGHDSSWIAPGANR